MQASFDASEVTRLLAGYVVIGRDMSAGMHIVAELLVERVHVQYDTSGGGAWPPMAASTAAGRRSGAGAGRDRHGKFLKKGATVTHQLLRDTGAMERSTEGAWERFEASASTNDPKIGFHASKAPRTKIPYRNPFDLPQSDIDDAAEALLDWVLSKMARV